MIILVYLISFFAFIMIYAIFACLYKRKIGRKLNQYYSPPLSLKIKRSTMIFFAILFYLFSVFFVFISLIIKRTPADRIIVMVHSVVIFLLVLTADPNLKTFKYLIRRGSSGDFIEFGYYYK